MSKRKPLSKKSRFEIFKRDNFKCQYCGQGTPDVVLECDHIEPVSSGGNNDHENLVTACFSCNRGKGARSLDGNLPNLSERREVMKERKLQMNAYEKLRREYRETIQSYVNSICSIYEAEFDEWTLTPTAQQSVRQFLEKLAFSDVEFAMTKACQTKTINHAFKYFCGICWRMIKDGVDV